MLIRAESACDVVSLRLNAPACFTVRCFYVESTDPPADTKPREGTTELADIKGIVYLSQFIPSRITINYFHDELLTPYGTLFVHPFYFPLLSSQLSSKKYHKPRGVVVKMTNWNGGSEIRLEDTNKSSRFHYESGDSTNQLLFKGLEVSVKPTLRSLYLENCYFDAQELLSTLDACVNLAIIKLYDVSINHEDIEVPTDTFRKVHLPKLTTLHVHDVSNRNKSILDCPFHRVEDVDKANEQQALAHFNVVFYSQLLQSQLSLSGCKYLFFCKFNTLNVNLSIKMAGYTIIKYSPLSTFEKLVISPLLDTCKNQFMRNEQDQARIKYLSCSDKVLSVLSTPKALDDLNLYMSGDQSLLVDLAISKKLHCLKSLTLFFHQRQAIDLNTISTGLKNLKELVITNAIINSTATSPLVLSECAFDQCEFSDLFVNNVPQLLNCQSIAIDVQSVPTWKDTFKTNLMGVPQVVRIVVWSVDTDDDEKVLFAEIYSKRENGSSFIWNTSSFDDVNIRRPILLNHSDFFNVNTSFPIHMLEGIDVPKGSSFDMISFARGGLSNSFFAVFMAVIALMVYSYRQ
ncbi:unnamed protein product [Allacma fusca]|uniref:Uncharacterized protein n=1 Tax=Allacma fusca TaxID=39272 RepID=A0A8J2KQA0_9HEXA|nr:unnamed protein product [Allacma fusca]